MIYVFIVHICDTLIFQIFTVLEEGRIYLILIVDAILLILIGAIVHFLALDLQL
jgi:hypothetical protein